MKYITNPTPEQIAKLPKWAQRHISSLSRERVAAVEALKKATDNQTESNVWTWDFVNTGEKGGDAYVKTYFQCDRLEIEAAGVRLSIDGWYTNEEIRLSWRPAGEGHLIGDICFIPTTYQQAKLVHPKNSRPRI